MAKFYFFTDLDKLSEQTSATQAFGPLAPPSGGNDRYQVTSLHASTADAKAYAVCDGIAFIQEQTGNANLVNLILKPLSQPPFAFPKIKFFIYRGIKKDSLIAGAIIAASTTNDLTKSIWDSQVARNSSAGTSDDPPMEALGIDITGTGSIDDVFYRTNVSYQLPIVKAGWKIGTFTSAGFGLEIMTEAIGFDPTLDLARTNTHIIEVTTLGASPAQPEMFEHWHDKEAILNYIDPCAFFGSFYHNKLKVKSSNAITDNMNGNELYDDLLVKFFNKNKVYLDIRNEYNHSFNYFKNYGTSINAAFNGTTTAAINYYRSGWPILILTNSDFQSNTTSKNTIKIQMPDGDGDNTLPLMYVSAGYLSSTYPREPKGKNKLIDLVVTDNLTDVISLTVSNKSGEPSTTAISSYIKLKYNKRLDPNNIVASSGTVIRAQNYLDNVFAPFDMKIPFSENVNIKSATYDEEIFIDLTEEMSQNHISSVGIGIDTSNISFFAFPKITRLLDSGELVTTPLSISGEINSQDEDYFAIITRRFSKGVRKSQFDLTPTDVEYIEIVDENISDRSLGSPSFDGFIGFLVNGSTEWDSLNILWNSDFISKYRVYFGFKNQTSGLDDNGYSYTSYHLFLRGFELNSGAIKVKEVNSNLKIYTNG